MDATSRDEVDDTIIDFDGLVSNLLEGSFQMNLPPSSFRSSNDENPSPDKEEETGPTKRRKTTDTRKDRKKVVNDSQFDQFKLREGEDWARDFCGKCVDQRPFWKGKCKMCARWHILGNCFGSCHHAESHVPKEEVPKEKEEAFGKYVNAVRNK